MWAKPAVWEKFDSRTLTSCTWGVRRKELLKVTGIICIIVPHPSRFLQGIDLIWESVGGDMFTTCTRALAQGGRLIVIGMMSQYSDGWAPSKVT